MDTRFGHLQTTNAAGIQINTNKKIYEKHE